MYLIKHVSKQIKAFNTKTKLYYLYLAVTLLFKKNYTVTSTHRYHQVVLLQNIQLIYTYTANFMYIS